MKAINWMDNGNTAVLNDEKLMNVSGGFDGYEVTETRYDIAKGDTFQNGIHFFVIATDGKRLPPETLATCLRYTYHQVTGKYTDEGYTHCRLDGLAGYTYLGNNVITEDMIDEDRGPIIRVV